MSESVEKKKSRPPRWQKVVVWALLMASAGIGAALEQALGGDWINVLLSLAFSCLILLAGGHYRWQAIRRAAYMKAELADQVAFATQVFLLKSTAIQALARKFAKEMDDPEVQERLLGLWRNLANTKFPDGVDKGLIDMRDWAAKMAAAEIPPEMLQ